VIGPLRRNCIVLFAAGFALAFVACGGDGGSDTTRPNESAGQPTRGGELSLVALGDSIPAADPQNCDGCTGFVDLYANQLSQQLNARVQVDNRAVPDTEASDLLDQVKNDDATRAALKRADLIVIDIGFNDSPWNRLDDPCDAAPNYPVVMWGKITQGCIAKVAGQYGQTLNAILSEVNDLRAGRPTALRLVTVYNSVIGDYVDPSWDDPAAVAPSKAANDKFVETQCRLTRMHGGECIDVYHTFNGNDGSHPAKRFLASDYTHPNSEGHKLIAKLLAQSGYHPSQP
jgi:lysophospholipase L1-like esterase